MSTRIPMEKLPNTRDLGGMTGEGGRKIRPGLLIRSGQLVEASAADLEELSRRIELVVDFRNMDEHVHVPDPEIQGVEQIHLPILDGRGPGVAEDEASRREAMRALFEDPKKPREAMMHIYEDFVSKPHCLGQYRRFLEMLMKDREKAVLWHCAAGKDRAGFGSVLVQELLGVSRDDIFEDYMITNVYLKERIEEMTEDAMRRSGQTSKEMRQALGYLFAAREELLQAVYRKVEELYGDFNGLFEKGMGIPREKMDTMRERYLN